MVVRFSILGQLENLGISCESYWESFSVEFPRPGVLVSRSTANLGKILGGLPVPTTPRGCQLSQSTTEQSDLATATSRLTGLGIPRHCCRSSMKSSGPTPPTRRQHAQSHRSPTVWPDSRLGIATTLHAARLQHGQHVLYNSAHLRDNKGRRLFRCRRPRQDNLFLLLFAIRVPLPCVTLWTAAALTPFLGVVECGSDIHATA